ncbi:MAG: triple tyrosine motif-containing protein, partial [Ferruginibacter sp.]
LKKDAADNIWILTSHGLFQYDTHNGTMRTYTTADGIYDLNEDKIGFFDYNGLFYIGYRMAMTVFDPLSVNVNRVKAHPVITQININNLPLNENIDSFTLHPLSLSYRNNNISFGFTAPDFTNSDKITFAYRLEGYDKDWILCGTARTATYTNLKGGNYTFLVKACNSSGVWNNNAVSVRIKVGTPFWQTAWIYILGGLLIFLIVYLLYRRRIRRLVELYKIRDSISKNLHDEIGATLSSINIYSDVARKKEAPDTEINLLMERIYKASGRVMESMNDIVWYVNPKNDSWDNITVRMREYAIPLLEAKNIRPDFRMNETLFRYKLDMQQRQHVYFIFKEAINNIVKYAAATEVKVTLEKKEKNILLVITDNGKGFDMQTVRRGNGLHNMEQRAASMKGKLQLFSEPGEGTVVSLQVPIT